MGRTNDIFDRASAELDIDLYSALIHGDPAAIVETPAYRDRLQSLRDVVSGLVCGATVCDPLIRALSAAASGAPNAQALAIVAIDALVSAHVSTHADAAAEHAEAYA